MDELSPLQTNLYAICGIHIIPSHDIPNGFRHTVECNVFVSPQNYELMRPLSAKGMIIALGCLTEQVPEEAGILRDPATRQNVSVTRHPTLPSEDADENETTPP